MTRDALYAAITAKASYLCVGLDPDMAKIPSHLRSESDPLFTYLKSLVDATADYAVAYKPNTAFFECLGPKGYDTLQRLAEYLPQDTFNIADAKRGDIGNTAQCYATAFFETMGFDAMTVNPLMGEDAVRPFLERPGKWAIVLALTSNAGANDFLTQRMSGWRLYQRIILSLLRWGTPDNTMFVLGATNGKAQLADVRQLAPEHFFLVPGVGAQGGSLAEASQALLNEQCGILVNASRAIMYAGEGRGYAEAARRAAHSYQQEMKALLEAR